MSKAASQYHVSIYVARWRMNDHRCARDRGEIASPESSRDGGRPHRQCTALDDGQLNLATVLVHLHPWRTQRGVLVACESQSRKAEAHSLRVAFASSPVLGCRSVGSLGL